MGVRVLFGVLLAAPAGAAVTIATPLRAGATPSGTTCGGADQLPSTWNCTWTKALPDQGAPIALSSPIVADLDGQPSAVVGDRTGNLYAFHLGNPSPGTSPTAPTIPGGWSNGGNVGVTDESGPIDSTPSVLSRPGTNDSVLVGSGNDADPDTGGYQAYGPAGHREWFTPVVDPSSDAHPAAGVEAGIAIGNLQPSSGTGASASAGSLGQVGYTIAASTGAPLRGWPFFDSDSVHATAALADLYGTGVDEIIQGADQSAGTGRGQTYQNGGHVRILSGTGNLICRADTNQVVDSSPAVGGFLPGGATGIVVGTGTFFANASDTDTVTAFDTHCRSVWSARLDGGTFSSPALSDVLGNGSLQVVEGTDAGSAGSVWVLDAATGATDWRVSLPSPVVGSVVTADLTGSGHDDIVAPTENGAYVLDGQTGQQIAYLGADVGLQNSPLVTADPNGTVGITLAGYSGVVTGGQGVVYHYEISGINAGQAVGTGAWPMFHHDPQLTGDAGGTPAPGSVPGCSIPAAALEGYDLVASDGGIFAYPTPDRPFCGSMGGSHLNAPIVGIAMSPSTGGYWEVASDGGVFAFGEAGFHGSMGASHLNAPIVGIAATPDGGGYWLVAADGGIFAFGDARFLGSMGGSHLNAAIVGISPSADGRGYRLVASDGGIFAFGDAPFSGSMGGAPLAEPMVGTATDTSTGGYWEVAADGGIFSFGQAPFYGSSGGTPLAAPVVGMAASDDAFGYRLVAADGGLFSFSAPFSGSAGGTRLQKPVVGMAGF